MSNFLELGIDLKERKVIVDKLDIKPVQMKDGSNANKLVLTVTDKTTGKSFEISDAWVEHDKSSKKIQGMWLPKSDHIPLASAIGRILNYYSVEKIKDLAGLEVDVFPDKNDYLVLAACEMKTYSTLEKTNLFNENNESTSSGV